MRTARWCRRSYRVGQRSTGLHFTADQTRAGLGYTTWPARTPDWKSSERSSLTRLLGSVKRTVCRQAATRSRWHLPGKRTVRPWVAEMATFRLGMMVGNRRTDSVFGGHHDGWQVRSLDALPGRRSLFRRKIIAWRDGVLRPQCAPGNLSARIPIAMASGQREGLLFGIPGGQPTVA